MDKCPVHPDHDMTFRCSKYNTELCSLCATCKDPELYCKFRPSCIIWYNRKKEDGATRDIAV